MFSKTVADINNIDLSILHTGIYIINYIENGKFVTKKVFKK